MTKSMQVCLITLQYPLSILKQPTTESIPVCCITLFGEVNAERRTDYEPIKVDYHSIIAGVPQGWYTFHPF